MTRSHFGSIQYLGKDRYRVSVEGDRDESGGRHRPGHVVRGTRHDAEIELARMCLDAGKPIRTDMTVSEYWETVYRPSIDSLAPSTVNGYERIWKRYVRDLFGKTKLRDLKARFIESKLSTIPAPGEQDNAYKLMRQIVNLAYRDELMDDNPFLRRIRRARKRAYEPPVLTLEKVSDWCDAVRGTRYEAVLLCMLFGGLRREEAAALYWGDIAFADGFAVIGVDKALTEVSGRKVAGPTKTPRSERTVFVSGYAAERLEELQLQGPLVPLCADETGHRMAPDKITKEYKAMMPDSLYVPPRNLRTSYATMQQALGTPDSVISRTLGHSNLQVDYNHYFASNQTAYMAAAKALGDELVTRCNTGKKEAAC